MTGTTTPERRYDVDVDSTESRQLYTGVGDLQPGARVGPFEIVERLGRGGVGVVYRAKVAATTILPLGHEVAVKMLRISDIGSINRKRFEREAAYLQALNHPGIVKLFDIGEHHGNPYMVMQLVRGRSLDELMPRGDDAFKVTENQICDIVVQALEALHTAHLAGILHRDLKPGNIMVRPDGRVMLLDFGMAQRRRDESRLTASGSVLGTPAYMSPEQARGSRAHFDRRSDIYSMGAVMYELATGRQPFRAQNSIAVLRAILEEPLTPPSRIRKHLSRDLETVILRAMAKDPRDRYPNAEAMAVDLRRIAAGLRIRSWRPSRVRMLGRKLHYHRRTVAVAGLVLFVLGFATTLITVDVLQDLAEKRRIEEQQAELRRQMQARWTTVWYRDGEIEPGEDLLREPADHLGEGIVLLTPLDDEGRPLRIDGGVRISAEIYPLDPQAYLHVHFSNRYLGEGYGMRVQRSPKDPTRIVFSLTRSRTGTSEDAHEILEVGVIELGARGPLTPFQVRVVREDSLLVLRVREGRDGKFLETSFDDLLPFDSPDFARVLLTYRPETISVHDFEIERQRPPELINRIELADAARTDGRYSRALVLYRNFLRDYPESEQALPARYRIGLCQLALEDYQGAIETYRRIVDDLQNSEDSEKRRYRLAAIFQSWIAALRLGQLDQAENYFAVISRNYRNRTVLDSVPLDLLIDLPRTYLDRADDLVDEDPGRAMRLYDSGVDLADHLEQHRIAIRGHLNAGRMLFAQGEESAAIERFERALAYPECRGDLLVRAAGLLAQVHRVLGNDEDALAYYRKALGEEGAEREREEYVRLWTGDLLLHMGRPGEATAVWSAHAEGELIPSLIMRRLVARADRMPEAGPPYENDVAYFNAIIARLEGREEDYESTLAYALAYGDEMDWPYQLVEQILDRL